MAVPSVGEVNKQLWDEALTRLLDLSTATVKRNADLEARITELDLELSVWKQAHSAMVEVAERDKKAHNVQVATLNRQIASLEFIKNQNPLILCAIDGNTNIFNHSFLSQGQQGGRQAAQELTKGIAEYLSQEDVQVFGRLSFWVTMYFNKKGLLETLLGNEVCTAEQLEAFLLGFSQASPRFILVDVGPGKEATHAKMREYLQTFTRFPQTLRVFLGGDCDRAYLPTLTALSGEEMLGKLVFLHGCDEGYSGYQQLAVPSVQIAGLFSTENLSYKCRIPASIRLNGLNSVTTNDSPISPESDAYSGGTGVSSSGGKQIDPMKPLHKQSPPPCNEHYLMTCSKGAGCKYSHDWLLTQEQLDTLAKNAKKAPCNYLKNGLECPYNDKCCWGHVCPSGARCFHLSKGKCWFKGGMHPIPTLTTPQDS